MPARPPARPPADPRSFDEAVSWFRSKMILSDDEFEAIEAASHETAFTVAGVAQLDLVTQVWEAADRALAQGETLESFQRATADKLAAAWGKDQPWRVETIFRTNVQSAYSRGRWRQMNHPAVRRARPYRRYSAIMDSRTTTVCKHLDGVVRPADDTWWDGRIPPLHFNCRSCLVTLDEEEAAQEGVTDPPPDVEGEEGFGAVPGAPTAPDLSGYPPELAAAYHAPPARPKKRVPAEHTQEHWLHHYTANGFGAEAATSLSIARAQQERSLDRPVGEVLDHLDQLSPLHKVISQQLLDAAKAKHQRRRTLRELATDDTLPAEVRDGLDMVGALHGHATAPACATAAPALKPVGAPHGMERAIVESATKNLRPYWAASAPEVKVTWLPASTRAFASGVDVWVPSAGRALAEKTLEHELGHVLEHHSPERLRAAVEFLRARTSGEAEQPLSQLAPHLPWDPFEVARRDKFRDPYVGKAYAGDHATEVTSMGLQWMASEPQKFWREDREHFLFALGQLAAR